MAFLSARSPARNAVKAILRIELSMYCQLGSGMCFLGQLPQFARVRLYPLLHLFDERLRKEEVRRRRRQFRPVQAPRLLPPVRCSEPILLRDPQGRMIDRSKCSVHPIPSGTKIDCHRWRCQTYPRHNVIGPALRPRPSCCLPSSVSGGIDRADHVAGLQSCVDSRKFR